MIGFYKILARLSAVIVGICAAFAAVFAVCGQPVPAVAGAVIFVCHLKKRWQMVVPVMLFALAVISLFTGGAAVTSAVLAGMALVYAAYAMLERQMA